MMKFGENNVLCPKYIYIYMNFGGYGGGRTYSTVHFLFIIQKNEKSTRGAIIKSNSTSFYLKKNS